MDPSRTQLWRITDRQTFLALRQRGVRAQRGPLWVRALPGVATATAPQVGFAVGKQAGGAVVRNRIRRRLRAALRDLLSAGSLPPGVYLVGATGAVATMPWSELCDTLSAAIAEVTR